MLGQKRQVSDESDSISVFNFLLERLLFDFRTLTVMYYMEIGAFY